MKNSLSCTGVLKRNPGQRILALKNSVPNLYHLCYCKFKNRRCIQNVNTSWNYTYQYTLWITEQMVLYLKKC